MSGFLRGRFKPRIFANEQAQLDSRHFKHTSLVARCEITAFIKDLVVGKFLFGIGGNDLPLTHNTGPVETLGDRYAAALDTAALGVSHDNVHAF